MARIYLNIIIAYGFFYFASSPLLAMEDLEGIHDTPLQPIPPSLNSVDYEQELTESLIIYATLGDAVSSKSPPPEEPLKDKDKGEDKKKKKKKKDKKKEKKTTRNPLKFFSYRRTLKKEEKKNKSLSHSSPISTRVSSKTPPQPITISPSTQIFSCRGFPDLSYDLPPLNFGLSGLDEDMEPPPSPSKNVSTSTSQEQ